MSGLLDFLNGPPVPVNNAGGGLLGNMGNPQQPFKSNMLDANGMPVASDPAAPPMAMYAPGSVPQPAPPQQDPLGHLPQWLQQFMRYDAMLSQMNAERHRANSGR